MFMRDDTLLDGSTTSQTIGIAVNADAVVGAALTAMLTLGTTARSGVEAPAVMDPEMDVMPVAGSRPNPAPLETERMRNA
jgi:hypothetical protein